MSKIACDASYSIAAVSKLTGVSCHALRVWERRYGFPVPARSPSGHRRFSADQVHVIRKVADLARGGEPIGNLIESVRSGQLVLDAVQSEPRFEGAERAMFEILVDRLASADLEGADQIYDKLAKQMSQLDLITTVINPAMTDIGDRWYRRDCSIYQERTVTGFLRRKLDHMLETAQRANPNPKRIVLVGTVQGDRHQGGALMFGVLVELAGWRALDLGVDLPVSEYQKAALAWKPDAIGLSFVLSRNINKRFKELSLIRDVPVFVGGRSILNYQGLARKHGLIPLFGPIADSIIAFQAEMESRSRRAPAEDLVR